ncbi:hypothetical protein ABW636_05265 [Aquimarina sp. 2201CG1-2-11]|uniref:hypothetical protein n=1 Tax=Aquimarina discodermiae TaxID=3231043 RepID=UPI003463371B
MNDFDKLKKDWKSVKTTKTELKNDSNSLIERLKKLQRKIITGNIISSILFIPTIFMVGWLWTAYEKGNTLFYGSLFCLAILILFTIGIFWYRVLFWKTPELDKNVKSFATIMIKKLSYYKWITNIYMPVYSVLLTAILFAYFQTILKDADFWFSFWAYTLTFGWAIGVSFVGIKRKRKKNKKEIDPILHDLKQIKEAF